MTDVSENCGRGHDVSQICCAHAEIVQTRLREAEQTLEKIDALAVIVVRGCGTHSLEAEKELGALLLDRIKGRAMAPSGEG